MLLQDIERKSGDGDGDDGVSLKDGVSRDRMMSVHDPEMRHGHKSSSRRFDGHKAAIVVDTDSQLITAVEVLPGNAPDNLGALELVEASEANTGVPVEEAMGDAAYGDGDTRQAFADAGRTLIARVRGRPDRKHFPKEDFHIDLEAGSCTCPAGNVPRRIRPWGTRTAATGRTRQLKAFQFDGAVCGVCPLRPRARDGRCNCTRRRLYCSSPGPRSGVRHLASTGSAGWWWSTGWRGWSNWESAKHATSAASKPGFSCTWLPPWPTCPWWPPKPVWQKIPAALPASAAPSVPGPSVPPLMSSLRGSVKILTLALLTSASLPKYISPDRAFRPGF